MSRLLAWMAVSALLLTAPGRVLQQALPAAPDREAAYRSNNRGVALLEQYQYESAAAAFRDALRIDPSLALARLNLSIALYYAPDLQGAAREAAEAARLLPSAPQPPYVLGLVARADNREADAARSFERVRELDPRDAGAAINLAQIYLQQRKYAEAAAVLRPAVADEPYNVTAAYNLGLALSRAGNAEEGRQMMERSQALRATGYGTTLSNTYLEQGRYAEAVASTGAEPDLVDRATPAVSFSSGSLARTADTGGGPGCAVLFDADGDGDLDLFVARSAVQRFFRNDGRGAFSDATDAANLAAPSSSTAAAACVAGDVDNDGLPDLLVVRPGKSSLYRNAAATRFTDVAAAAGIPGMSSPAAAALADVDHDGDLDIVLSPLTLLRNNGNGTFSDVTRVAGLAAGARAIAIVPTDFDNRRDLDLLIVTADAAPMLFKNMRDGTFKDVAAEAGIADVFTTRATDRITGAAAGDVNKDDFPDFFFGRSAGPGLLALSDGAGRYRVVPVPEAGSGASSVQLFDYDNDGLIDVVAWTRDGIHVARNVGTAWMDVTAAAAPARLPAPAAAQSVSVGDVDSDGDDDVVLLSSDASGPIALRNSGNARNRSVRVQLKGRVSNRSGVGSKVQVRAGSLTQRIETSAASPAVAPADVVFGLGTRAGGDVVRVLWPSGTVQAEIGTPLPSSMAVEELDRKPSSCPFLFTWNGERFEFVTDFMGGGEMGYWEGPGQRNRPDPLEYVRVRADQLRESAGRYEIRVTNELEETLFADRLQLMSIVHPSDVEVYPDEGMTDPPKPFRLFGARDAGPPVSVVDEHGHDVSRQVASLDRRYPDDFDLKPFRGYAGAHALTIDIGTRRSPLLILTGWTDYAFSSDNMAAHQAGLALAPPSLQIKDRAGQWRTEIVDIGIPVGRPQALVVDLTARLRDGEHEVRILTNMRIYWDQIRVATKVSADRFMRSMHAAIRADLRERGFSAERRPDGREPLTYDYENVSTTSPWKTMIGRYTRPGDVRPLVASTDDLFVIAKPGDEISLSFEAPAARNLPAGWTRTFLLVADGFSKEMDINSASPDRVEPLPFHGMSGYPYGGRERYPDSAVHRNYRARYNTRPVVR